MERLYRTMRADADGLPHVGRSARGLGVRLHGPHADVTPDEDGRVHPGAGGMSVTADDPARMPVARRPHWLGHGASEDPLFRLDASTVVAPLTVRLDAGAHALIDPGAVMGLDGYERALAATRPGWQREGEP